MQTTSSLIQCVQISCAMAVALAELMMARVWGAAALKARFASIDHPPWSDAYVFDAVRKWA
ncbi:MAG: hypothetical protein GX575_01835 [Candidatus Anammoximicrobium sp.]|nr:hypothetical protein [Candidatus Anammoximicrobium sp.]